jgi:ribosomal protein L15
VIQLGRLGKLKGVIDRDALKKAGIISARTSGPIKILSSGSAPAAVTIQGLAVSRAARKKIEDAKGRIE